MCSRRLELPQCAISWALGCREGGEKSKQIIVLLMVLFSETETVKQNRKILFLSFFASRRRGGGGRRREKKARTNFGFCTRGSASVCKVHSSAIGVYEAVSSHHALRVREVSSRKDTALPVGSSRAGGSCRAAPGC